MDLVIVVISIVFVVALLMLALRLLLSYSYNHLLILVMVPTITSTIMPIKVTIVLLTIILHIVRGGLIAHRCGVTSRLAVRCMIDTFHLTRQCLLRTLDFCLDFLVNVHFFQILSLLLTVCDLRFQLLDFI